MTSEELFSVYYESNAALGSIIERECYLVPLKEAMKWYRHHTSNVSAMAGFTRRVFITDSGDQIVAEWIEGRVVWPKEDC
jgi:hypothetical protein